MPSSRTAAPSLPELLSQLQRCSVEHRLRVDECFKDYDRHRDGTITVPQFQGALSMTFGRHKPLSQKQPNIVDAIAKGEIDMVINIRDSKADEGSISDGYLIRRKAVDFSTTLTVPPSMTPPSGTGSA